MNRFQQINAKKMQIVLDDGCCNVKEQKNKSKIVSFQLQVES
jgi:hypothetical protein